MAVAVACAAVLLAVPPTSTAGDGSRSIAPIPTKQQGMAVRRAPRMERNATSSLLAAHDSPSMKDASSLAKEFLVKNGLMATPTATPNAQRCPFYQVAEDFGWSSEEARLVFVVAKGCVGDLTEEDHEDMRQMGMTQDQLNNKVELYKGNEKAKRELSPYELSQAASLHWLPHTFHVYKRMLAKATAKLTQEEKDAARRLGKTTKELAEEKVPGPEEWTEDAVTTEKKYLLEEQEGGSPCSASTPEEKLVFKMQSGCFGEADREEMQQLGLNEVDLAERAAEKTLDSRAVGQLTSSELDQAKRLGMTPREFLQNKREILEERRASGRGVLVGRS